MNYMGKLCLAEKIRETAVSNERDFPSSIRDGSSLHTATMPTLLPPSSNSEAMEPEVLTYNIRTTQS